MRRPAQTREQRQHAREQRALLALRRAAVRYSLVNEPEPDDPAKVDHVVISFAFADLCAACDRYRESLPKREARKLAVRPTR